MVMMDEGKEEERGVWKAEQGGNEHLGMLRAPQRIRRRERSGSR